VSKAKLGFKSQLLVTGSIFVGLFFLEYPPIFLFGYWSWGTAAHKTLTGILLVLNLLLAQFTARRLGFFAAHKHGIDGTRPGVPET
jgi:hypothetical protein